MPDTQPEVRAVTEAEFQRLRAAAQMRFNPDVHDPILAGARDRIREWNLNRTQHQATVEGPVLPEFREEFNTVGIGPSMEQSTNGQETIRAVYGLRIPSNIDKIINQHKGEVIIGVELEVENFPTDIEQSSKGLDFTSDGSLRNNGIEAVTRPNTKVGTLNVVKEFWSKFNIESGNNFSDRTSIHVHANVTHFNSKQIRSLVLLYSLFEDILFDVVSPERKDNIFCVPWSQAGMHVGNYQRVWTHASSWQKYTALNLRPIASQGTVEFRHMQGHADFDLLANWLTIIEELMLAAERMDHDAIYKSVINLNTSSDYGKFLSEVFPLSASYLSAKSPDWRNHMIRGVIEAKLSTRGN